MQTFNHPVLIFKHWLRFHCPAPVFKQAKVSMLLRRCLFCLFCFSHIQGHTALPRDRLLGLSHRDSSLCHLVASNPSARSLSFLAQLGGSHNGTVLFQTSWSWQGELEQCISWQEESITSAYLAFCLEKWDQPQPSGTFLRVWDSQLEGDLRDLEEWGGKCSSPLTSPAAVGPESPSRLPRGRRSAWPAPLGTLYTGSRSWFHPDPIAAAADRHRGARRSRRGWTLPGTIWCGAGDSAENFTDLGIFDQTDLCCREHDHCAHKISAFEYNYGMRNFRLHTVSHCDCDYRFRKCLLNVNDTMSTLVGITFFSIFQIPCFNLELVERCVKKTWWSRCNVTELVPQAILHPQSKYNYSQPILDPLQMGSGSKPTLSPAMTGRQNQTATSLNLLPNSTQGRKIKNKKKCRNRRRKTKVPSQNTLKMRADMMSTMVHNETDFSPAHGQNLMKNSLPVELKEEGVSRKLLQRNASNAVNSQGNGSTAIGWDENISKEHGLTILGELSTASSLPISNPRSCKCYKPLDQCEHTISPLEFKFSYYNQEHKTLYHCDCTKRLAKRMKKRVNVNTVEELLLEFVSPSCFRLKSVLGNCSKEERAPCEKQLHSTVAVLSKPKHLQKILKARRTVDESLYPLSKQQERVKNETSTGTDSVKLYNKCLQMIQALTVKA
ncbi:group 3 secretory phospholipase A2 [Mustelus asterias]